MADDDESVADLLLQTIETQRKSIEILEAQVQSLKDTIGLQRATIERLQWRSAK